MDLFEDEQRVLDEALEVIEKVKEGEEFCFEEFVTITKEYAKLLKQLRRSTRIADRTAVDLNENNVILEESVNIDALTGIYNRRFMEDALTRVVSTLSRSDGILSVLMMDIDFFKKYNDTYGHSAGDDCLKLVAGALAKTLSRKDDFVARYGGEEFAIILPNTDELGARYLAGNVLESIRNLAIPHENSDVSDFVTISVGVTSGTVGCSGGVDYIQRADRALYISKSEGRNRYTYLDFKDNL